MTVTRIPSRGPDISYSRLADDGIYSRREGDHQAEDAVSLAFPVGIGKKWHLASDTTKLEMEIVAVEDFATGGKVYHQCLRLFGEGSEGQLKVMEVLHYAPKVGLVGLSIFTSITNVEMTLRDDKTAGP